MADWTSNLTGVAQLDDYLVALYDRQWIISGEKTRNLDSLMTIRRDFKAKSITFPVYTKLTAQTSALNSREDPTSEAMADSVVTLTPAEYGNVVTLTNLADLQSAGVDTLAAIELAAINAAESQETLFIKVAEAATNELIVTQAAESSLTSSDTLTANYVAQAYNKLARRGIPKINGSYFAIAHPDVIYDLKVQTGDGTWVGTNQYSRPEEVLMGEVGMFGGFRWVASPLVSINANAGSGNVDSYHNIFFGFNAFGKAVSQPVMPKITGPFDKLGRFINIGWHGTFKYGIIDSNAVQLVTCASSVGANS